MPRWSLRVVGSLLVASVLIMPLPFVGCGGGSDRNPTNPMGNADTTDAGPWSADGSGSTGDSLVEATVVDTHDLVAVDTVQTEDEAGPTCTYFSVVTYGGGLGGVDYASSPLFLAGPDPLVCLVEYAPPKSSSAKPIVVSVEPTLRPIVLGLSAKEQVTWSLDLAEGAEVTSIIVYGPRQDEEAHLVEGAGTIPVELRREEGFPLCETELGLLLADFEDHAGGPLDIIAQYSNSSPSGALESYVTLAHHEEPGCDPACTPVCSGKECGADGCLGSCGTCSPGEVCTAGVCLPLEPFPSCSTILEESSACIGIVGSRLSVMGLDSGSACLGEVTTKDGADNAEVFWSSMIYSCFDYFGFAGLLVRDPIDGREILLDIPCDTVGYAEGGLLVAGGGLIERFDDPDDLMDGGGELLGDYGDEGVYNPTQRGGVLYYLMKKPKAVEGVYNLGLVRVDLFDDTEQILYVPFEPLGMDFSYTYYDFTGMAIVGDDLVGVTVSFEKSGSFLYGELFFVDGLTGEIVGEQLLGADFSIRGCAAKVAWEGGSPW